MEILPYPLEEYHFYPIDLFHYVHFSDRPVCLVHESLRPKGGIGGKSRGEVVETKD